MGNINIKTNTGNITHDSAMNITSSATLNIEESADVDVEISSVVKTHVDSDALTMVDGSFVMLNCTPPATGSSLQNISSTLGMLQTVASTLSIAAPTFTSSLTGLSTAFSNIASIAGTFGSITSVADGLTALGNIGTNLVTALSKFNQFTQGFAGINKAFRSISMSGPMFSGLTTFGRFISIDSALNGLSNLTGLSQFPALKGVFSNLATLSNSAKLFEVARGSVNSNSTLEQVKGVMEDIYNWTQVPPHSAALTQMESNGADVSTMIDDVSGDLDDLIAFFETL